MLGRLAGNHLDTAQSQASSHSSLHIFILKLVQEAQKSLGKGRMADLDTGSLNPNLTGKSCQTYPFPEDRSK